MVATKNKQEITEKKVMRILNNMGIELTVADAWGYIKGHACATPWCAQTITQWNMRKMERWYSARNVKIPEGVRTWRRFTLCYKCAARVWETRFRSAKGRWLH